MHQLPAPCSVDLIRRGEDLFVTLPVEFRTGVSCGEQLVFVRHVHCGLMYLRKEAYVRFEGYLREREERNSLQGKMLQRMVYASIAEIPVSEDGRALIPARFGEVFEEQGNAIVVDFGDHFCAWPSEEWEEVGKRYRHWDRE